MLPAVVLDKNFLQGATSPAIHALAATHRLIMPGALFFELLTTSTETRKACFGRLPQTENPVDLVDHIEALLRHEMEHRAPAGLPSSHRLTLRFRFNRKLLDENYALPTEAAIALTEMEVATEEKIDSLLELSETIPSLFPGLLDGAMDTQHAAYVSAQRLISDPAKVADFYVTLESPGPSTHFPPIKRNPEDWAFVRWLQVKMLFATHLFVRYRGRLRQMLTPAVRLRLEHDVHDAQILALGVLEGALATKEKKLREWFHLLKPGAILLP